MIHIGVTGHRPDKLAGYDRDNPLRRALRARFTEMALCVVASRLLETGDAQAEVFTGMAQGWDQDVACACIRAELPFVACVPFAGQERFWTPDARDDYAAILSRAKRVASGSERAPQPQSKAEAVHLLHARNRFIVDSTDVVIACFDGSSGGTSNCIAYAQQRRKRVIVIDPRDFAAWREWRNLVVAEEIARQRAARERHASRQAELIIVFGDES